MSSLSDDSIHAHGPASPRIGLCRACARPGQLNARICRSCETRYGRRLAELMARARADVNFARRCYEQLSPAARRLFLDALGSSVRFGPGLRKCNKRRGASLRVVGQ